MITLALMMSGRVFGALQNFIVTALLIRFAPEQDTAAYIYCFMIGNLVSFFGLASLEPLVMKRVHEAENPAAINLSSYTYAAMAMVVVPYVFALFYFGLQAGRPATIDAFFYAAVWIASNALLLPSAYLRARLDLRREAITILSFECAMFLVKAGLIVAGLEPKHLFLLFGVANFGLFWLLRSAPSARQATFLGRVNWREIWATMKAAAPYIVSVGVGNLYFRAAFLTFTPSLNDAELVTVGIVGQLVTAGGLVAYALINAMYPVQQRLNAEEGRFRQLLWGVYCFSAVWGLAVGVGLLAVGNVFVGIIFGRLDLIPQMAFLFIGLHIALQTMVNVRNNVVLIKGSAREVVILNSVSLVLAVGVSFALTPINNIVGFTAALTAAAAAGLLAGVATNTSRRYYNDLWAWMRPDRIWPSVMAIRQEVARGARN